MPARIVIEGTGQSALAAIRTTQAELKALQGQAVSTDRALATVGRTPMMARLGPALGRAGATLDTIATKSSRVGSALNRHVTVPLLAAGVGAIKLAGDFEQSMTHIETLVGLGHKTVEGFRTSVLKMAGDVSQGVTQGPKELADALYFITSSGIPASKAMDVLKASAQGATAGLGTTATVADALTSAMNAYASSGLKAHEATDILLNAVKLGKVEAAELAKSIGRVIPVAAKMGVSFKEVGGSIATMSLQGLDAAEATTALRAVLTTLLHPSHQAAGELDKLGLSAADVRNEVKDKGLNVTLQDLFHRMGAVTPGAKDLAASMKEAKTQLGDGADKSQIAARAQEILATRFKDNNEQVGQLFGNVRALVGALILTANKGKDTNRVMGEMGKGVDVTGKAARRAAEDINKRFGAAWGRIQAQLIRIGSVIGPLAATGIEKIGNAVSKVVDWFDKLDSGSKKIVGIVAAAALVAGPVVRLVGVFARAGQGAALAGSFIARNWSRGATEVQVSSARMEASVGAAVMAMQRASATTSTMRFAPTGVTTPVGAAGAGAAGMAPGIARADQAAGRLSRTMGFLGKNLSAGRIGMGLFTAGMVGSFVPGLGKAVTGISQLTATGAGLGMMFGPEGAMAGGLAGLNIGLQSVLPRALDAGHGIGTVGSAILDVLVPPLGIANHLLGAFGVSLGGPSDKEKELTTATQGLSDALQAEAGQIQRTSAAQAQHKDAVQAVTTAHKEYLTAVQQSMREVATSGQTSAKTAARVTEAEEKLRQARIEQREAAHLEAVEEKAMAAALDHTADSVIRYAQANKNAKGNLDKFRQGMLEVAQTAKRENLPTIRRNADAVLDLSQKIKGVPPRWVTEMLMRTQGKSEYDDAIEDVQRAYQIWRSTKGRISFSVAMSVEHLGTRYPHREGGLAGGPVAVSSGERIFTPFGQVFDVPGTRTAADNVMMHLPVGSAVVTDHGQRLMAGGASLGEALARQLPHFARGGRLTAGQIAGFAYRAGFPRSKVATATAVALGESGGDPRSTNTAGNHPPSTDAGLWQINSYWEKAWWKRGMGWLFDPANNARAAAAISRHGATFSPWVAYTNGRYRQFLGAARAGVEHMGSAGSDRGDRTSGHMAGTALISRAAAYASGFLRGYGEDADPVLPGVLKALGYVKPPARASDSSRISQRGGRSWPTSPHGKIIGTPYAGTHTLGNWQSDRAIDIGLPMGSRILAVTDGVLSGLAHGTHDWSNRFAGDSLYLKGGGDTYWYKHLSKLIGRSGQRVGAGDVIGRSGMASGVAHLHFAEQNRRPFGYSRGGVVGWPAVYRAGMQAIWGAARGYFPHSGRMPPVRYYSGKDALFIGTDVEGGPGKRMTYWPKWADFVHGGKHRNRRNAFLQTVLHEWAHNFQSRATMGSFWESEGGAEAFSRAIAARVYAAAGIKGYRNPPAVGPYARAMFRVAREHGRDWIHEGQFAQGRKFQAGGVVGTAQSVSALSRPLGGILGRIDTGAAGEAVYRAVQAALKALTKHLGAMTVDAIRRMQARIVRRIAILRAGTESPDEEREIKRLQGALRLVDEALGKKIGAMVRRLVVAAGAIGTRIDRQTTRESLAQRQAVARGALTHRAPEAVTVEGDVETVAFLKEVLAERMEQVKLLQRALAKAIKEHAPKDVVAGIRSDLDDALGELDEANTSLVESEAQLAQDVANAIDAHNQRTLDLASSRLRLAELTGGDVGAALQEVIAAQQAILTAAAERLNALLLDTIPDSLQADAIQAATTDVVNATIDVAQAEHDAADAEHDAADASRDAADAAREFAASARESAANVATAGEEDHTGFDVQVAGGRVTAAFGELPAPIRNYLESIGLSTPAQIASWVKGQARAQALGMTNWLSSWEEAPENRASIEALKNASGEYINATFSATQAAQNAASSMDDFSSSVDGATDAAQEFSGKVGSFVGRIEARISAAFDKITEQGVAAIRAPLDALLKQQEQADITNRIEDARGALAKAQLLGDPARIKEAQRELDAALFDQKRADLEKQNDEAEQAYRDQRDAQKEILSDQLADLDQALQDGKLSYANWANQVNALMQSNGLPAMENMGTLMGQAFVGAFMYELGQLARWLAASGQSPGTSQPPPTTGTGTGPGGKIGWKVFGATADGRMVYMTQQGTLVYEDGTPFGGTTKQPASPSDIPTGPSSRYTSVPPSTAYRATSDLTTPGVSPLVMPGSGAGGAGAGAGVAQVSRIGGAGGRAEVIVVKVGTRTLFEIIKDESDRYVVNNGRTWS